MSYIITSTKLKNIADAVRYKCGGYLMNISTMISKLSQLKQGNGLIDVSQSSGEMALWNAVRIATFDTVHDGAEYHRIINPSTMTTMYGMFAEWPFTDTLDFQDFGDTSNVINMSYMFENNQATSLTNLTYLNTSNVRNMNYMFNNCSKVTSLDLSGWNLSSVTTMAYMFHGFSSYRYPYHPSPSIDLSGWNTINVTNMNHMFSSMYNGSGKIWAPSTFKATNVTDEFSKPFYYPPNDSEQLPFGYWHIYTDATDAETQGWGTIHSNFIVYYNSTHQDFLDAFT